MAKANGVLGLPELTTLEFSPQNSCNNRLKVQCLSTYAPGSSRYWINCPGGQTFFHASASDLK